MKSKTSIIRICRVIQILCMLTWFSLMFSTTNTYKSMGLFFGGLMFNLLVYLLICSFLEKKGISETDFTTIK